eukprot:TRINITY_DN14515_c0_g1_i1.p3 TRINITY_DN14515_c0_g1~~TRINITY_DN14515_c0_g1_i1.p3  ORF type:complete len:107 (+),score=20.44 TRINITY_DN14515_c0_g1_i1:876-1196(+)
MSGGLMNVSVDKDFARFGSKSYAINKINTVDVRERKPYGQLGMFIFGVLCFIFGMAALGGLSEKSLSGSITSFIFAAIDRKSGSAGMPRPISYAVFCLKKKNRAPF